MNWKDGALSESVTEHLLMLQAEAKEKARLVRNCPYCRTGWRDTADDCVTRCICFKDWKRAVIDLRGAVKKAKEKREEWETDEMFNLNSVTGATA